MSQKNWIGVVEEARWSMNDDSRRVAEVGRRWRRMEVDPNQ
jgi:hypothetical protein